MKRMISIAVCMVMLCSPSAFPHCQVPCGIYDDEARFKAIEEDILTLEKSMNEIIKLSGNETKDFNQIVRWIDNKDFHADKISETATYYFLAQRVIPAAPGDAAYAKYAEKLAMLHELVYYSMKAKQGTDTAVLGKLRAALSRFKELYYGK